MNSESEFPELNENDADAPRSIRMAVGERAINGVEIELIERMEREFHALMPMPFIEPINDNDPTGLVELSNWEDFAHFFDGQRPTIKQVYDLGRDLEVLVIEKWRPVITVARALGPYRSKDGGPTVAEFIAACEREGVKPPKPEGV